MVKELLESLILLWKFAICTYVIEGITFFWVIKDFDLGFLIDNHSNAKVFLKVLEVYGAFSCLLNDLV
jgi:hypothetical protein